jgi:hypothetical protein
LIKIALDMCPPQWLSDCVNVYTEPAHPFTY